MKDFVPKHNYHRIAGMIYIILSVVYIVFLIKFLNYQNWWLSLPFLGAQLFTFFSVLLSVINNWKLNFRTKRPQISGNPPAVSVVIPTYKEPKHVLRRTIKSLLHLSYEGDLVFVVSNDDQRDSQKKMLRELMIEMNQYWQDRYTGSGGTRDLYLVHSEPHQDAKAGNLNQAVKFLRRHFADIDLILTMDADEISYPDLVKAIVGYFEDPVVAYVQTVKQADVPKEDLFGNNDYMFYGRTQPARDSSNSIIACGSGVMWRISAIESIGGFDTWNIVEDLTTSYQLLAVGWRGKYHYEALSRGLAPQDLANYLKQRGTWAIDSLRIFFWDNPFFKREAQFNLRQKLQFLETPIFYLNGFANLTLVVATSLSLIFRIWPTTKGSLEHALYLIPSFIAMEIYFLLLAGKIPFRRARQYWVGLSPNYAIAAFKAFFYGPNRKPKYKVTRKVDKYANYLNLAVPQMLFLILIFLSVLISVLQTPVHSGFDWGVVFWGMYQASYFFYVIRLSVYNWVPDIQISFAGFSNKLRSRIRGLSDISLDLSFE